jgi:hypothetical protein
MFQKYRKLIIAAVLGLTFLIILGALTNNISSKFGSSNISSTQTQNLSKSNSKFETKDTLNGFGTNTYSDANAPGVTATAPEAPKAKLNTAFSSRKIILSGSMAIETNKFDHATSVISTRVQGVGGYIETSEITGVKSENGNYLENRTASYTIRVPATKFQNFMNEIGKIGVVTSKNMGGEDVTSQYIDSQARLKSQKVKETRLIDILKKAKNLTDVLAIETELENTRYEIENLTSSLKKWDNLVTYSTLTISLREVAESKALVKKPVTLADKISNSFNSSLKLLADLSKGLLIALVAALPFIVIFAVIFAIVLLIVKRKGNGNRNN